MSKTITVKLTQHKGVLNGTYLRSAELLTVAYDNSNTDTFKILAIESNKMLLKTAKIGFPCSTTLSFDKQ
jgi:hypothetical protein